MDALPRIVERLRIAHHVPGRIRLKLDADAEAAAGLLAEARAFGRAVADMPGIRGVEVNPLARSCVVRYDPAAIPPAAWPDLLAGARTEAAATLRRVLAGPA